MAGPTKLFVKRPGNKGAVGSRNRSRRFIKHSILAKQARTLTGKKLIINEQELNSVPEGGITSCFFKEYLDQENMQNPCKIFSMFYRDAYALVQSQALFLHSFPKLVQLFVAGLDNTEDDDSFQLAVPSLLRLIAVLGRDASPQLVFAHLPQLLTACLAQVDAGNVELTTLVFETVGKLFEHCHAPMLESDPKLDVLHSTFYVEYLGHSSELVRNLAGEVAAFLLRKQTSMNQKLHLWSLLRFTADSRVGDATANLFLHVIRGVNGAFRSQMPKIVASLVRAMARKAETDQDRVDSLLRWLQAAQKFAAQPSDIIQVLLQEFDTILQTGGDFAFQLCQPWLELCSAEELDQFTAKLNKPPASSTQLEFCLILWNSGNAMLQDLVFQADRTCELFLACLDKLDFDRWFVPNVLPLLPQTWAFAQVWIAVSKLSSKQEHLRTSALLSEETGRVILTSEFQLPRSTSEVSPHDLLEFLRWVEPKQPNGKLGNMLLTEFPEIDNEADAEVYGLWALASMIHASGKSLPRIIAKLTTCETFCTRDGMEALALAKAEDIALSSPELVANISKQLAHPSHDTRLAAFKLLKHSFPESEPIQILESIHLLEATYENERPREVLGDSLKQSLLRAENLTPALPALCFAVLGMFHIRYRPTWTLAGNLLECVVSSTSADQCWPHIFYFFQQNAQFHVRYESSASSSESTFSYFMKSIGSGALLLRMFQRQSKDWIPHFFAFLQHEFYPALGEETLVELMSERELEIASSVAAIAEDNAVTGSFAKRKLNSYLEVMCTFDQKKQVFELELLKLVWKRMLLVSANAANALKCLQRFCGSALETSRQVLDLLIKSKEYRNALVEVSALFRESSNDVLEEILSRVLFSKLVESSSSQKHSVSVSERRRQILHCFASLQDPKWFIQLLLRPFAVIDLSVGLSQFARSALEGFLLVLEQVLPILGKRLDAYIKEIALQVCKIVEISLDNKHPLLRKESLNRLAEIFRLFAASVDLSGAFPTVNRAVTKMLCTSTEDDHQSALFQVISVCFQQAQVRFRCLSESVFTESFLGRIATTQSVGVLESVFEVVDQMLAEQAFTTKFVEVFLSAITARRTRVSTPMSEPELEIVEKVAKFASQGKDMDSKLVVQLIDLLSDHLTFQGKKSKSAAALGVQLKTMTALSVLISPPHKTNAALANKVQLVLAKLFGPWAEHSMVRSAEDRLVLAELFALYHEPIAGQALKQLNSMIHGKVQVDYDVPARLDQYQALCSSNNTAQFDDLTAAVLLNQSMYDLMECEDFSIRLTAQAFCTHVLKSQEMGALCREAVERGVIYALDKVDTCTVRANILQVLRSVVLCPSATLFSDLAFLASESDADSDFFLNASHIQASRRSKTMNRFASAVEQLSRVSEQSLTYVILPIAMHAVFDEESQKNEQEAGIALVAACSHQFSNSSTVCTLLNHIFKRISKAVESRTMRRLYIKTACVVYDEHAAKSPMVDLKFTKKLFKLLVSERTKHFDEELNENVAVSLAQRCRDRETELNSLLLVVCGQLKRRKQTARDIARQCLVKLAKLLGVNRYFPLMFQHMSACLNEGGYQIHVLGYTLYQLMEAMQTETVQHGKAWESNQLDSILPSVLKIVLEEIFEKSAPTVESGYHSKIKLREVRQGKALDTLECLATCISFLPHNSMHLLVEPFLVRTHMDATTGEMNKCKEAFVRIRAGLLKNPTVTKENLLVYCHHALTEQKPEKIHDADEEVYEDEEQAIPVKGSAYRDRLRYVPGQQLTGTSAQKHANNKRLRMQRETEQHREFLFIEFCLEWMHQACFAGRVSVAEEQQLLLPIVELVITDICLSASSSQRSLVLGLRIVDDYLEHGGDNTAAALSSKLHQQLINRCLQFLKKNAQSAVLVSADVSKSSVDLITTLLSKQLVKLRAEDCKLLIRICHLDLDNAIRFSSALRLLRCLFALQQPTPELYDIALRLNEMVFQHSIKRKEQSRCVELVCHFLLNFPLEKQRLEEHVQLIVKNISAYEHETGRLGGLQLLASILSRFPSELIDYFCDFFLVTLCLVLQNDDSNEVKLQTAKVLRALFHKLTKAKFTSSVLGYVEKWFAQPKTLALACQLAGLLPDKHLFDERLLQVVREEKDDDNALYQALVALERAMTPQNAIEVEHLPNLKSLLLHEDLWVRQVSSRMCSARIEAHGRLDCIEGFDFVLILVDQLDSDHVSDEFAPIILHNLQLVAKQSQVEWFAGKNAIPLPWILNKLCYIASRPEPLDLALKNRRRRAVFQFFEMVFSVDQQGMAADLVKSIVKSLHVVHVSHMDRFDPLGDLRARVLDLMKQSIGVDALAAAMDQDQRVRTERRREKRSKRDVERVVPTARKRVKQQ